MSTKSRHELLLALRPQYAEASVGEKKQLLNGFITATGYNRKYAITLLKNGRIEKNGKRNRKRKYGDDVVAALTFVWKAANRPCSKRLVPFLPKLVESLVRFDHLSITDAVKEQLLSLSPATMDRLLSHERRQYGKAKSTTTSGHLIKAHIPIRTFADWNDVMPGFLEADLVAHCGENVRGKYLNTLTMTDVATGWTEPFALMGKGEDEVLGAIEEIVKLLPIQLKGIDTDNGGEFINYQLAAWCLRHGITFTRSREYRKNDQAHVEEKNGSIVRKLIGYERYDSMDSWGILTQLYGIARLYINFFQPCVKLISKERDGARVRKKYDKAKTPCERILESPLVAEERKDRLRDLFRSLDPLLLLREIERYQIELRKYAVNGNAQRTVDDQHCKPATSGCLAGDLNVIDSDPSPAIDAQPIGKRKRPKAVRAKTKASEMPSPIDHAREPEHRPGIEVPDMIYEPGPMHPSSLSTLIEKFVNDHLRKQRRSDNTIASYNDSLRLLHQFAQRHLNKDATTLKIADLTVSLVQAFLDDMEHRGVSTSSRNLRLTVVHCFCRYIRAEITSAPPSLSAVLKLRGDKYTRPTIDFLTTQEVEAILAAPDRSTWTGRRDHAFLTIALETGLLVSELIKLTRKNLKRLETGVHICVADKGRSQRFIPLTQQAVDVLNSWMQEPNHRNAQTLFPNARGGCLTDDAVRYILNMQIGTACESCPSLEEKRVTPFILRHTRALQLLQSGLERDKLTYWLGLNSAGSIQTYIDADIALRKKALKEQRNKSS